MPDPNLTEPWWTPWPGVGPGHDLLGDIGGLTVLELGCGNGENAAAFAHAGAHVTAVDRNPDKIRTARQGWHDHANLRFVHADAARLVGSLGVVAGRTEAGDLSSQMLRE